MEVLIIIPTYNEKENIIPLISYIFKINPDFLILVVDDNSPDGTAAAVKELQNNFPRLELKQRAGARGFGRSYLEGFKEALQNRNQAVIMMDADFSHDAREIQEMADKLSEFDLVIGSRYIKGGKIENWSFHRRLLSYFANFYARVIPGVPIRDLTTGFMCFRTDVLNKIDLNSIRSEGYAFLVELKYKIFKAGFKIYEHPIIFSERREGQSKMSFKNIWEAIFLPWKLRFSKN